MSRGCTEQVPPIPGRGTLESWPHLSLEATRWRVGSEPHPGSTMELSLVARVRVSQPEGISVGDLTLAVRKTSHKVMSMRQLALSIIS